MMRTVTFTEAEIAYILSALARQRYALERYIQMQRAEPGAQQELARLQDIVEKLSCKPAGVQHAAPFSPEGEALGRD